MRPGILSKNSVLCRFGGPVGFIAFMWSLVAPAHGFVDTTTFVSGVDPVTALAGPANGQPFPNAFTAADFDAASTGVTPNIIVPHPAWESSLAAPFDAAQWISLAPNGTTASVSTLYAFEFTVTNAALITSATLEFHFYVDNALGSTTGGIDGSGNLIGPSLNEGLFVNGGTINGTSGTDGSLAGTTSPNYFGFQAPEKGFVNLDISSLLVDGSNYIYINQTNFGGPSGIIFGGEIVVTGTDPVPEPNILLLVMVAGLGLWFMRGRRLQC